MAVNLFNGNGFVEPKFHIYMIKEEMAAVISERTISPHPHNLSWTIDKIDNR